MGDRANVYIHEGAEPGVYLYTHWSGTELPTTVQAALRRGQDRWTDVQYLGRIVFCEMVRGNEERTDGFGISAYLGDGDRNIVDIDVAAQRVEHRRSGEARGWSFKEFVAADLTDDEDE